MAEIFEDYRNKAKFFQVYIREAHPSDGWQLPVNKKEGVVYRQPKTEEERAAIASDCRRNLDVAMPVLLDDMKNSTDRAYAAAPVRLYVIDKDGKVAFKGRPGPRGFVPSELRRFMEKTFGPPERQARPGTDGPAPPPNPGGGRKERPPSSG